LVVLVSLPAEEAENDDDQEAAHACVASVSRLCFTRVIVPRSKVFILASTMQAKSSGSLPITHRDLTLPTKTGEAIQSSRLGL